jgi:glycosyltransferase involved in cell wall biosynthesis
MPKVSVIIPTYNRAPWIGHAVSSVLNQTYQDLEIIVVDDGSTDGTAGLLSNYGNNIRSLKHTRNRGVSAARNTGIRESAGPLIAFLDSDDRWLPEKLAVQVRFFQDNPDAVACQSEEIWMRNGRRVNPGKRHLKPSGAIFEPSLRLCLVSPSAVMLRRSLLEEVGLFDEDLPACEDYDLWLRISSRHPVYLIREYLVVKTGGHADQLSARFRGMDRFRIKALVKLIRGGTLDDPQLRAALKELHRKCRIYGEGCLKRGRTEEGNLFLSLPDSIK